jgi:CheY-like chemotaxis protein
MRVGGIAGHSSAPRQQSRTFYSSLPLPRRSRRRGAFLLYPRVTPHGREDGEPLRILVAEADCALVGLLKEWFATLGRVLGHADEASERYDVIVVDLPFPRQEGLDTVNALAREHPGTPIVALSAHLLPGVEPCGHVARELGVACVLPKPVRREALMAELKKVVKMQVVKTR